MSAFLALLALVPSGCREVLLRPASEELWFEVDTLDLGTGAVGELLEAELLLQNGGRTELEVEWAQEGDGFELPLEDRVPAGGLRVLVRFQVPGEGAFEGQLRATVPDGREVSVRLAARGARHRCPAATACSSWRFDAALGDCVEELFADGIGCDPGSRCMQDASCQRGRCVGTPLRCDDGNACTLDVCDAARGCEFPPAPPCPGDDLCQVGTCDPKLGCGLAPAADGLVCGSKVGCDAAEVCISGECVVRDPPDGFVCLPASPCQAEGRCRGSVCESPPARPLTPDWTHDSAVESQHPLHDFLLEPNGAMTLTGFFSSPVLRANAVVSRAATQPARRCLLWNARLICADYSYERVGRVAALDPASGRVHWTFDVTQARPDFLRVAREIYMSRMAVLAGDRLAALFEASPADDATHHCRTYFLVVLDASGKLVRGDRLADPMLDDRTLGCAHPHPYGIASDAGGGLYLAISPSRHDNASPMPVGPTLLLAFDRDGALRWKRTEPFTGGELAVASGVLLAERSPDAFLTSDGRPWGHLGQSLAGGSVGRPAITRSGLVIPSPGLGEERLQAVDLATGARRWQYRFPSGTGLASPQVRLASWFDSGRQREETVALVFARSGWGSSSLTAVRTTDGAEAWSCPVQVDPMGPQLFELSPDRLGVMGGAVGCGQCDPPFSGSAARFSTFDLPGVREADEPWPGAAAGARHDHHERR